jgi:hypothetical protein
MATPNANSILGLSLSTQDLTTPAAPTTTNRILSALVVQCQQVLYNAALFVPLVAVSLLPNPLTTTAIVAFVRNVGTGPFQVNITFAFAAGTSLILQPGAFLFQYCPIINAGATVSGVLTLAVQQAGSTNAFCESYVGA